MKEHTDSTTSSTKGSRSSKAATAAPESLNAVVLSVKKPISRLSESDFYNWLLSFAPVFETLAESLGFAPNIAASVNNDAAWAKYILQREVLLSKTLDLTRLFRNAFYNGSLKGQDTPPVPDDIVEPKVPSTPMQAGVYLRMLNLVTQIRKSPGFNAVVAAQLGLDWKPGSGQTSSELKLEAFQTSKGLQLRWLKAGVKNAAAYFEYDPTGKGDEKNFQYLQTATLSPLTVMPQLPEGVSAAVWALRYCIIVNNVPTKIWSNAVQATVSTVINKPKRV